MLPGQHRYFRLDLKPEVVVSGKVKYTRHDIHEWSPERIFSQDDLYTTLCGSVPNVDIERFFFGPLDNGAPAALDFFSKYADLDVDEAAFQNLMRYMSVQKLRTPKGLGLLAELTGSTDANVTLMNLQQFQNLFCAIWTESVWQIADASDFADKIHYLRSSGDGLQPGLSPAVEVVQGGERSRRAHARFSHLLPTVIEQSSDPDEPKLGAESVPSRISRDWAGVPHTLANFIC
jgi:hypothetical protein